MSRNLLSWTQVRVFTLLLASLWLAGCGGGANPPSTSGTGAPARVGGGGGADKLRIGDLVKISFSGNPTPPMEQEERIKDDGMINLQFLGPIQAEGKTPGDLQREIQGLYVPKLYTRLTVTLKTENRFFYVDGEVRSSGRLIYAEEITVMRAIAAAGGFNDFAARTRVELVRATGEKLVIDARKTKNNPKLDPIVLPGDQIFVPRRSPFGK
jgi:polysaccharide export outer membrane protein